MQYSTIGQYIRYKRKLYNYKRNNFAFDCGIEPASLCKFEKGQSDVYFQNFIKIAEGFNIPASQLLLEYEKTKH